MNDTLGNRSDRTKLSDKQSATKLGSETDRMQKLGEKCTNRLKTGQNPWKNKIGRPKTLVDERTGKTETLQTVQNCRAKFV